MWRTSGTHLKLGLIHIVLERVFPDLHDCLTEGVGQEVVALGALGVCEPVQEAGGDPPPLQAAILLAGLPLPLSLLCT